MKPRSIFLGFFLLALGFFPLGLSVGSDDKPGIQPAYPQIMPEIKDLRSGPLSFGGLPLSFEANRGQIEDRVKFLCRGIHHTLYLTPTEAVLELARSKSSAPAIVRMKFEGAAASPQVIGEENLPGARNYFVGTDPKKWLTKIPHFARIRYREVYPGVDLVFYGDNQQLEFDFVVAAGADPSSVVFALEGAKALRLDQRGDLSVDLGSGEVLIRRPCIYQGTKGEARDISGQFVLLAGNRVGFEVESYDPNRPLIIDPTLSYSTFYGGSGWEGAFSFAADASGNIYFCSSPGNSNFLTVKPFQSSYGGGESDGFVGKLNAAGNAMIYATYLGGNGRDQAENIAVDALGNAYVTGSTASTNFPLVNPVQSSLGGTSICKGDAFVTKLNSDGSALFYSTYLGGSSDDIAYGIAVDVGGNAFVMGNTSSSNFPTKNPFQGALKGSADAFVAKLNASGTALVYSTYLGGSDWDASYGFGGGDIDVDAAGCAYLTSNTAGGGFPIVNGFQSKFGGGDYDTFVTKFYPSGSDLMYSTYLGGSQNEKAWAIAVAPNGSVAVAGDTASTNFPTWNPFRANLSGKKDVYVTVLGPSGSDLVFSTYLGGSTEIDGNEHASAVSFGPSNNVCVVGWTNSTDFPVANPIQSSFKGGVDAYVSVLSADGQNLIFSTYLGESEGDDARGGGFDAAGNIYLGGGTFSPNFPTVNALQASYGGECDIFISRIQMGPAGPVPTMTSISPSSAVAGDPAFTLKVKGSNFLSGAVVNWDGSSRSTTYVKNSELTASISADNLAAGKVVQVTVTNPGGGVSNSLPFSISNPAPTLSGISPTKAMAGGAELTLIVTGSKFVPNSVIRWNAKDQSTTYVSNTELKAVIPASDLTTGGDVQVTVHNPAPAGGTSGGLTFSIADFSLRASPSSVSVSAGQSATYQISLTPAHGSYDTVVSLTCSGLPTACTSSFSQASLTPGSGGASCTLTLSTKSSIAALVETIFGSTGRIPPELGFAVFLLALIFFSRAPAIQAWKKRFHLAWVRSAATICLIILLSSCGGSSGGGGDEKPKTGTPAGTYTITVEGKAGSLTRTATVTLVVK